MTDVQTAPASSGGRRARGGGADARRAARTSTAIRQVGFIHRAIKTYEPFTTEQLELIEHNAETVLQEVGLNFYEDDEAIANRRTKSVFFTVALAFFLAELGDKTMLATITLATDHGMVGTWLGSTVGMVAADALAIVVGQQLGARLPERVIKIGAAVTFFVFGVLLIVEGLL